MALIRVRPKQPIDGRQDELEVDEGWLDRWPDDFERVDDSVQPQPKAAASAIAAASRDDDHDF